MAFIVTDFDYEEVEDFEKVHHVNSEYHFHEAIGKKTKSLFLCCSITAFDNSNRDQGQLTCTLEKTYPIDKGIDKADIHNSIIFGLMTFQDRVKKNPKNTPFYKRCIEESEKIECKKYEENLKHVLIKLNLM